MIEQIQRYERRTLTHAILMISIALLLSFAHHAPALGKTSFAHTGFIPGSFALDDERAAGCIAPDRASLDVDDVAGDFMLCFH
jgi:hypothetical protein